MARLYHPNLVLADIPPLVKQLYGVEVTVVKELDSYDDQNFHVEVLTGFSAPSHETSAIPIGYIFKIMNSWDSKRPDILEAQTNIILHVEQSGYPTPRPILNLKQKYQELLDLSHQKIDENRTEQYVARLFSFMPGKTLAEVPLSNALCFEIGWFAGKMDVILKEFHTDNPVFSTMTRKWNMSEIPKLRSKVHAVTSQEQMTLCEEIINQFEAQVLFCQDKFSQGLIHSDFNDYNILVSEHGMKSSFRDIFSAVKKDWYEFINRKSKSLEIPHGHCQTYESTNIDNESFNISGIIDFGDATLSLYVFEIAIAIVYTMLKKSEIPPMQVAYHVLAGYLQHMSLSTTELESLKLCICARFVQSLVSGYSSWVLYPSNEYILIHAKKVWPVLKSLWMMPDSEVLRQLMELV